MAGAPGPPTALRIGGRPGSWIGIRLGALAGKVPADGRGVTLRVVAGGREQTLDVGAGGPNLIVGVGDREPALVTATWPNGTTEYLFEPAAGRVHEIQLVLRMEGSCPFLYADAGDGMRFVTDLLGTSPLGMVRAEGVPMPYDEDEYLPLPPWVEAEDGRVELLITEELREIAYFDTARLLVVDAPDDLEVLTGDRLVRGGVRGLDLRLLRSVQPPVAVIADDGRNITETVRQEDQRYLTNHAASRRYQGAVTPHELTIELPETIAAAGRPVLVLVGWLHWGNTSTNLARSQDPGGAPLGPILEVPDGRGGWRSTDLAVGLPAGKTKPIVVELGEVLDRSDPRVRLVTDAEVYWDRVAAAAAVGTDARVTPVGPARAELGWGGFSRWYRPAPNGPFLFDRSEVRPYPWRVDERGREVPVAWRELEGWMTAYGDVCDLVAEVDDRFVLLGSGDELRLTYDLKVVPALPDGWRRTLVLHSEGWDKDGDPNVRCGQTVGPLPFHGMGEVLCPPGPVDEVTAPPDDDHRRTRWVDADRLLRRVRALRRTSPP